MSRREPIFRSRDPFTSIAQLVWCMIYGDLYGTIPYRNYGVWYGTIPYHPVNITASSFNLGPVVVLPKAGMSLARQEFFRHQGMKGPGMGPGASEKSSTW